ncbi:phospholipase [Yersinia pestis]|uniref:Phospholipase A n=11 Tax=Yersinia pseudotuberculosis complex TaxID=1649845 RepID=A0AAX2I2X2_YERPE|nr:MULTISPECIES: DUF2974 domain-containing protein [Yersinia pseudotuberculosis complex]EDR33570.1 lipase family protein [Yersinia pestis biovar Orientalis str. IP275]EFA49075.1 extracellular phospholipase A1 family protein [Yersinia pestis KIM D27]ERP71507.1 phospholipase A [Yersinia pestis S3]ERP72247.1 phospholipase A [Yersinia pestis 24H]CQD58064.1 phospholipase A [Yersinia intermedia]
MSASVSLTTPVSVSCLINDVNPSVKAKKEDATAVTTTQAPKIAEAIHRSTPTLADNVLYDSTSYTHGVTTGSTNVPISSGQRPQQADYSLALLAKDVYAPTSGNLNGFVRLSDERLLAAGIDPTALSDSASGFLAGIYSDNQQYVLSFAGTNDRHDWLSNIRQAVGYEDVQYNEAVALGKTAKMAFGDALVITGHSLGGGLAATAALATGTFAVTFNAAGVAKNTLKRLGMDSAKARRSAENGGIRSYSEKYDLLTGIQELTSLIPNAVGHKIVLANSDKLTGVDDWLPHKHLERRISAHSIEKVLSSMSEQQPWERRYV